MPTTLSDIIDKKTLRAQGLAARSVLDDAYCEAAARRVAAHLLPLVPAGAAVAGYSPIRRELNVLPALHELAARGQLLCLPVTVAPGEPLVFRTWRLDSALVKGHYAIDIPNEENIREPDIILAPLLAFDDQGHRLGYGMGYYDRTIKALRAKKPVSVIGAAYSVQRVPHIPADAHDERLDAVVTEEGVMHFQ